MAQIELEGLKRGELAARAGVNIETLRFYERKGLLPKPPRGTSNYRQYPVDAVRRVRLIKRAQDLGFSLKEIDELLTLRAKPRARCADVQERAEAKIAEIEEKIRSLRSMKKALVKLVNQCSGSRPVDDCPILDAIDGEP